MKFEKQIELYDGMLPSMGDTELPEYYALIRATCMKSDRNIYVCPGIPDQKLCVQCYQNRSSGSRYQYTWRKDWHSLSTFTMHHLVRSSRCQDCHENLATMDWAAECQHCVTAYLLYKDIFGRFRIGYEREVVKM